MAYIGRQNLGGAYRQLDDISSGFDGSDTTHTMQVNSANVTVGDVNQIILSLGGVIQKPGTDFTVSGSVLTFTTAPAANTSFFAVLLGSDNGGTVTPTDASVTNDKISSALTTIAGLTSAGAAGTVTSIAGANILVEANSLFIGDDVSGTTDTAANSVAVGIDALDAVTTGDANVAIGKSALSAVNTGGNNIAIGNQAGAALTDGTDNIAMGSNALDDAASSARNIAIGSSALTALNESGNTYNIGIGYDAGKSITTGLYNTLIGHLCGDGYDTEGNNTGIGLSVLGGSVAGGEYNVGVGNSALEVLTSGDNNVALGNSAGALISTGASNVCLGKDAGDTITTGDKNIVIGQNAAVYANDSDNGIIIGHDLAAYATNTHITMGTGSGNDRIYLAYHTNATWNRVSDERYKENIKPNTDCGLDFINDLNPITFTWKAKADIDPSLPDYDETKLEPTYDKKMYGMIAQEVKSAMDKHNITDFGGWGIEEKTGIQSIAQSMFVYPLIKAVQELSAKVKELEDA